MLILNLIQILILTVLPKLILTLKPISLVLIQIASTLHSWTGVWLKWHNYNRIQMLFRLLETSAHL